MPDKSTGYQAYMMRCWIDTESSAERERYHISLEDPHTGERYGFSRLDALVAFLRERLAGFGSGNDPPPVGEQDALYSDP